jgi:short-subunit dehydrogenase involved in D-alanine esterification of teichoic acids
MTPTTSRRCREADRGFPSINVLFNSAGIMRMETALDKSRDLSDPEASMGGTSTE